MLNRYTCHLCGYWADVGGDGWATCPECGRNDTEVTPTEEPAPVAAEPEWPPVTPEGED